MDSTMDLPRLAQVAECPQLLTILCTQVTEATMYPHQEVRDPVMDKDCGKTFGRKADNLDDHSAHLFPPYHLWSPIAMTPHPWISAGIRPYHDSRHAMVLAEKLSSCIRTTKLGQVFLAPATSASCMHVLAGHPATSTPCLLADIVNRRQHH